MKKLLTIVALCFSFSTVIASADEPPAPPPAGVSCKATYDSSTKLDDFCGCYEQQSKANCTLLKEPVCNDSMDIQVGLMGAAINNNLTKFCYNEAVALKAAGSSVTQQNCMDDVGLVYGSWLSKGKSGSMCTGHWY